MLQKRLKEILSQALVQKAKVRLVSKIERGNNITNVDVHCLHVLCVMLWRAKFYIN